MYLVAQNKGLLEAVDAPRRLKRSRPHPSCLVFTSHMVGGKRARPGPFLASDPKGLFKGLDEQYQVHLAMPHFGAYALPTPRCPNTALAAQERSAGLKRVKWTGCVWAQLFPVDRRDLQLLPPPNTLCCLGWGKTQSRLSLVTSLTCQAARASHAGASG